MIKYFSTGVFFIGYYTILTIVNTIIWVIKYSLLGVSFIVLSIVKLLIGIFKYTGKGILFTSYFVYKSLGKIITLPIKGFVFLSYLIFKTFILAGRNIKKTFTVSPEVKERRRLLKEEKERIAKEKREQLIFEKQRKAQEREEKLKAIQERKIEEQQRKRERRARQNEVYRNENLKLERKKLGDIINNFLEKLTKIPEKIKKRYENLSLVKSRRNRHAMEREALLINFEGEDAERSEHKILYQYVAKNSDGKIVKGLFEAFSKVEVHSFLLSEGHEVYSIKSSKWISFFYGRSATNRTKIKNKDLIFFLTQLSTYIKSGIPLVDSLKILTRQYKHKTYQRIFRNMIYDLTMGDNFSDALAKQGVAFPRLLINMIKAAEMTGELPEALDDMAEYFTETEKTRKQMVTALMYPSIIFVFATGVITFILIYVIPKFVDIYSNMSADEIPVFTQIVINASNFLQEKILWIALVLVIIAAIIVYLYKNVKLFRTMFQWLIMHLPGFGNIVIYNEVTMFTKTLASLLSHNVFITDSMEVLNKITNNEIYKMLILDTIANLAKGERISLAFKDHWAFPIPAYEMIVTGEMTGQLPDMMARVSSYYQELHKNAVTRIKTFIEPVLIVVLTVVVGAIILAIIIPMFSMYDQIR